MASLPHIEIARSQRWHRFLVYQKEHKKASRKCKKIRSDAISCDRIKRGGVIF